MMKFGDAKSVVEIIGLMRMAVRAEMDIAELPKMSTSYRRGAAVTLRLPLSLNSLLPNLSDTIEKRLEREAREEAELRLQDKMRDLAAELKVYDVDFGEPELNALREEIMAERIKEQYGSSTAA